MELNDSQLSGGLLRKRLKGAFNIVSRLKAANRAVSYLRLRLPGSECMLASVPR